MNIRTTIAIILALLPTAGAMAGTEELCDSLTRELQEVVVSAKQPVTRLEGSTMVSTIAGSSLADLGNALDVLEQLPMIKVQDNNVSIIGRSNIEVYIDGRPMRDGEELVQLQSSAIKRVELLMAPGAKYDSTTGAVLKITTRRRFAQGLSLTDQLQVHKRRKWSAVDFLALNYHTGDWDIFSEGSFNHDSPVIKGSTINTLIYNGSLAEVGSTQNNRNIANVCSGRAGFNYARGEQSLGGYYRLGSEQGRFTNTGTEWLDNEPAISRNIGRRISSQSHLVSLYYDNRFADRYHLHFDGNVRMSTGDTDVATSYPDSRYQTVRSTEDNSSKLYAGKIYLDMPLWGGDLSAGGQGSFTRTSLDYIMHNQTVEAYIPSSVTDARQISAAAFASWSRMWGPLSLSAGMRYEYVDYRFKLNGVADPDVSRRDHLLTPDISIGYSFNDQAQLSLSYKMATVRPPYSQLTGSLSYVGRNEIEGGNTSLRDERMHDLQLFGMWGNFMIQADFMRGIDTYAFVKERYPAPTLQLLMHPVNIDVSSLSLYLIWSKAVGCWTPNVTLGMYGQRLELAGTRYNTPICSYYFDNTIALPHGFAITANAYGSTAGYMHTNRFGTTWFSMDASVSKSFFDNALTVKLSASDIFNSASNDWSMLTYGVEVDKRQTYDRRGVLLGVTYRFQPRKSRYKGEAASQSELNRL